MGGVYKLVLQRHMKKFAAVFISLHATAAARYTCVRAALKCRDSIEKENADCLSSPIRNKPESIGKKTRRLMVTPITIGSKDYQLGKKLLYSAFPENERIPAWCLAIFSLGKKADFLSIYDGTTFCGFMYLVYEEKIMFLLYFAIDAKLRSQGYGKEVLALLKDAAGEKTVVLNVEVLDPNAPNYDQRAKRVNFYKRNGFYLTDYILTKDEDEYHILSSSPAFPLAELSDIVERYRMGSITKQKNCF